MRFINLTILMFSSFIYTATGRDDEKISSGLETKDLEFHSYRIIAAFKKNFEPKIMNLMTLSSNVIDFRNKISEKFQEELFNTLFNGSEYLKFELIGGSNLNLIFKVTGSFLEDPLVLKRGMQELPSKFNEGENLKILKDCHRTVDFYHCEFQSPEDLSLFVKMPSHKYLRSWLMMEYLDFNFNRYLKSRIDNGTNINEESIITMCQFLLNALVECHEKNIVHANLKIENIMGRECRNNNGKRVIRFVLIGFGSSVNFDDGREETCGLGCKVGTHGYFPPEVMREVPKLVEASDIWALGITLFISAFGNINMAEECVKDFFKTEQETIDKIINELHNFSNEVKSLLLKCLRIDHKERPTAKDLLSHPLFSN